MSVCTCVHACFPPLVKGVISAPVSAEKGEGPGGFTKEDVEDGTSHQASGHPRSAGRRLRGSEGWHWGLGSRAGLGPRQRVGGLRPPARREVSRQTVEGQGSSLKAEHQALYSISMALRPPPTLTTDSTSG